MSRDALRIPATRAATLCPDHVAWMLADDLERLAVKWRGRHPDVVDFLAGALHGAGLWTELRAGREDATSLASTARPAALSTLMSADVAERLGITPAAVSKAAREQRLRGEKRGGTWTFDPADVERYAHRNSQT